MSKDIAEVRRCLHSLAMPFFHHEAVKQALLMALDDPAKQDPVLQMLGQLADSSDISGSQMLRVRHCCCGISLDAVKDWGATWEAQEGLLRDRTCLQRFAYLGT